MIHRLRLRNWRAYEQLDLEFQAGTTFIVAPNGVGKSSLVLALAWAAFGDHALAQARDCIRAGTNEASVQLDMRLPSGAELAITRTVKLTGRPKVSALLDGRELSQDDLALVYAEEFHVAMPIAARLSLMAGGGAVASTTPLNLEDHLYEAFGVKDVVVNAATARTVAKKAARRREKIRQSGKARLEDRQHLETQLAELEAKHALAQERVADLKASLAQVDQNRATVVHIAEQAERLRRYETDLVALIGRAQNAMRDVAIDIEAPEIPLPIGLGETIDRLGALIATVTFRAEQASTAETAARATIASASHALDLLASPTAVCPTCLRPIGIDEVTHAIAQHQSRQEAAEPEADERGREARDDRQRLGTLQTIASELQRLQAHPPAADIDVPDQLTIEGLAQQRADILDAVEEASRDVGALQRQVQDLRARLDDDDRLAEEDEKLLRAYRDEALAQAAAEALETAAHGAVETLIEPIKNEVRWRWKRLFHDDGLEFRADGSMVRLAQGRELGWESLSGGEQTWARIVAHLLILSSSTTLPFAWFDEPLEHLDPNLRHSVAATLATATRAGSPPQLLVTTYEHALASQLADDLDEAHVINLREASPGTPL